MDRKGLEINMSREEVGMDDISKRLVHNKVCNVTVKRNKNKLESALAVIQELVKSGRLHAEGEVETIRTPERLKEYMDHCKQSGEYVLDVETTGLDIYNDILVGICLYTPGETSVYVPFNHTDLQNVRVADQMSEEQVRDMMIPYLQDQELRCINHNIKFDNKKLAWDWKQIIVNIYWDTQIAGNVLNENEPHKLKPMYNKYILHGKGSGEDYKDLFDGIPFNYVPIDIATVYGANDGFKTYALYKFQAQYLREDHPREDFRKMYYVFREVEMPLIPLCTDMEMRGVEIREDFAKELSEDFNKEMVEVEAKCDAYVEQFKQYILDHNNLMRLTKGTCKINYSSPQQVAALFYDIFKLRSVSRKEPRGTGDKIIQKFLSTAKKKDTKKSREFAEFLENYQRFKEIKKLLGTYVDKIPQVKEPKINAVYTTYNQYGAKTGRFSSSDTVSKINLQNIPSKEKRIRKIFKARDGYKLVGGDFSQIEPRVLAFLSGDESMINAYKEGKDLYAIMGSQVYQLPYEDCREFYPDGTVNAEGKHRRTTMKSVLLGIMYERGATAIGEQFNKSAEWAQQLIDNFYKSFPKINQYRLKIENMAETYGYVTTITGRKRRLPDMQLEDKDDYRYQEAHRQSLNSVIQGSSADIMKLSMIAIYNDPRYKALDCHMIITVHDELIMEVPEDHIKEGAELLVGTMKRVGHSLIDLPMSVDAEVNDYWYGENLAEKYGV
nr:MAG: DNA polymerase family A [Bacteriophage sp.]UWH97094.1 MAG: DNA polymerase family A [Bacteriophage sp.]